MADLNDPDELVMQMAYVLINGVGFGKPGIRLTLKVDNDKREYRVSIEMRIGDSEEKFKSHRKVFASGTAPTVAEARDRLMKSLMSRAQKILDLPIQGIMES